MEKSCDLGKDVRDGGKDAYMITRNKGKEPVIPDDVDTPADDELSLGSSPSLSPSLTKSAWESTKAEGAQEAFTSPLPSAMSLVAHPAGQGGKQTGGRTSQFRALGTCQYCSKVQCHRYCP